jgi:three-Cys-motif partner protein
MGGRIAYIDLFAGPGRYRDGAASVPLMVVQNAIDDAFLCQHLVTIFNDRDSNNTRTLESQISQIPGISKLRFPPRVYNEEVSDRIAKLFEETRLAPTLFFVDPWGYKSLSLRLVNSVLKDWGSDCIFFFNYNRINMGLGNAVVRERMEALFGSDRATHLRDRLAGMAPACREIAIVEEISTALKEMGGRYVVPFCFKNQVGTRTSHYLIFVSKHVKGYEIMKDVMAAASSMVNQGVPTFAYCPADQTMPFLFELARPLDQLESLLLKDFVGQTLPMEEVYNRHHVDRPFIKRNYKAALVSLESKGKIACDPPAERRLRRKGVVTLAGQVVVAFPQ